MITRNISPRGLYRLENTAACCPWRLPSHHVYSYPSLGRQNQHHIPKSKGQRFNRQATILIKLATQDAKPKFLQSLAGQIRPSAAAWKEMINTPQALVILATPNFVEWLEDDHFMARIIASVITRQESQCAASYELDVVCACVDGLTPDVEHFAHGERAKPGNSILLSPAGLALLQGPTKQLLPNLWEEENSFVVSQDLLSTLTFSAQKDFDTKITVPLANTLFTTGNRSTLLVSKWRADIDLSGNTGPISKLKSIRKKNQIINVFDNMSSIEPMTYIAAVPLTPARMIASGLGNIVRQLEFNTEDIGPASRELEIAVNDYIRSEQEKGEAVSSTAVWALIIPESVASSNDDDFVYSMTDDTKVAREGKLTWAPDPAVLDVVGHWVRKGAIFCRVLSGGGGWGAKQGLLSLDPQKVYTHTDGTDLEFFGRSLEEQQTSALGNMAQPGSYIRFYRSSSWIPRKMVEKQTIKSFDLAARTVVIGTTPSTIDEIPEEWSGDIGGAVDETVRVRPGYFGCVSQSGVYISKNLGKTGSEHDVKLDMPYSYLYASTESASHRTSSEPCRQKSRLPIKADHELGITR